MFWDYAVIWMIEEKGMRIQYQYNQSMQSTYANHSPTAPGKLLITTHATKLHEGEVQVAIHEHCLVQAVGMSKKYMEFDFELKFTYQLNPPTIIFEKAEERHSYALRSPGDLQRWRDILKDRLNQRGFHEQFKPKKKIGKGNFASVYLAEKLENGRNFAVKAFSKEAAYSEDKGKECLIKEIQIMRSLNHKSCMRLHEVFESDNSLYIVVELLQGGQLHDKIKGKHKFRSHQTKIVMQSILSGLREMHAKRIMHRDLKPENIIIRNQGSWECVIADFGLAEFADTEEYLFVRCGTPGFVAPEVINIKDMKTKYDPICDIFSLGLIFHLFLLGTSAFPGKTYNEVLAQNRASCITFQSEEYSTLDPQALALLKKMLKKEPHERISAAEALNHPYFTETMQDCEQLDVVPQLVLKSQSMPGESPLIGTSNCARKQLDKMKKDSCVDFKMGKESLFTGKVQTVPDTGSTANSVGKRFESFVSPKASKFTIKK